MELPGFNVGQRVGLAGAIGLATMLAAYGIAGSYETISRKAVEVDVPLPQLVPIGIDGGLVGVVVLDLVLAWTAHPIGWLRQLARLLAVGTVAANVSAGWPDPVAIGLHAVAPLMLLVMVEAGRTVLLRCAGGAAGCVRDRIPLGRWILSPWSTFLLWRRMVLWQITSYRAALDKEAQLRRTRTLLRVHFGRQWKRKAPADLLWMLGIAPLAEEAHSRVHAIISGNDKAEPAHAAQDGTTTSVLSGSSSVVMGDHLDAAVRINERHWTQRNRPVSAETLRKQLHVSSSRARELASAVRSMDRAAVSHG
ncbi:DUF2637 domain-containing protein [Actinocrispum wychmicini]|nr:DUF2637 domain-containing protein [Actinocrispum wychmicini]